MFVAALGTPARVAAQGYSGPASLRQLTRDADAVVQARIVASVAEIEAGGRTYPLVHADVIATLKGGVGPGPIAFANVGAGSATFVNGEEVLLFLRFIERVADLAATPLQARLRYVAIPNSGEVVVLTDAVRSVVMNAVHRYATVEVIPDPETRGEALRQLSLELLKSGDPILVTSVMRDFSPGGDAGALTLADLPAMVPLIESSRVPIGTRIALVAELERRSLIFGPARWVRLLRTSQGSDLLAVLHAVREHPSAGVNATVIPMLQHRDFSVATSAAIALGVPANVEAVKPLAACLGRDDHPLRMEALRSLARIGTQGARQALELAAARHPDPAIRQRAEIEAFTLARRHGTTLAPTLGLNPSDAALANAPALAPLDAGR
jgi:hypothetical protein